jgi:hypothetical protein
MKPPNGPKFSESRHSHAAQDIPVHQVNTITMTRGPNRAAHRGSNVLAGDLRYGRETEMQSEAVTQAAQTSPIALLASAVA